MELLIWFGVQALICAVVWWWFNKKRMGGQSRVSAPRSMKQDESVELRELQLMRGRSLNMPLCEKARPCSMEDIIGQSDGIKALIAAMCGPNPQHVIIYGPPGCGKTCAARLVLEEAKKRPDSPFDSSSKFVEVDATCVRFDERAIADPLMGSVHDPIYQGAGALGAQGVPQPKPGAVSRAHCGVLFLDEIGELHPLQMNKLLKVLEDRKVFFDSAYYSKDNNAIPRHIHDIFQNGLPADFRLVGATTRSPEDMPPALRSRCVELYFRPLKRHELEVIASDAAERLGLSIDDDAVTLCASYAESGRDAVNMIQLAGGACSDEKRASISVADIKWVAGVSRYSIRVSKRIPEKPEIGIVSGLAVSGTGQGIVIEIECDASRTEKGKGRLRVGGAVDEEELEMRQRKLRRKSTAQTSVENVCGAFLSRFSLDCRDYDISFNVPGGMPMDGPSAGIAFAAALLSAISGKAAIPGLALTGEITVKGAVRPVGGVREKLEAAIEAGASIVIIPEDNYEEDFDTLNASIVPVSDITQVMRIAFNIPRELAADDNVLPLICPA